VRISWSLASSTLPALVEEAKKCEEVGLYGVWFPDYEAPFAGWPELYVVLTMLARETKEVVIGSLVTDVLRRHPMVTAHAFATLSYIAPRRLILGLGAGGGTSHRPYGLRVERSASTLREGITVIRSLWRATKDRPVSLRGRRFQLDEAGSPLPPSSSIPIYVAAYAPKMLALTAQLADGWLPESHTPETYRITLSEIHRTMRANGRSPGSLEACCGLIFYPWEPSGPAFSGLLSAAKGYLACYPDIQWSAGEGRGHPGLRTHQVATDGSLWEKLKGEVPDWLAERTLICGGEEECIDKLAAFAEAGCSHVILEPYWIEADRLKEAVEIAGRISVKL